MRLVPLVAWVAPANVAEGGLLVPRLHYCQRRWSWWPRWIGVDMGYLKPSGLACELVVPQEWLDEIREDALKRQFARTPYAVSFLAGQTTFILVTTHVDYANPSPKRIPELKAIARWMAEWAQRSGDWEHNPLAQLDPDSSPRVWSKLRHNQTASPIHNCQIPAAAKSHAFARASGRVSKRAPTE